MRLDSLTPREIVAELDRFIVGQNAAKKAVAVALRNRWRRQQLDPSLREEVAPKNIIMIGPTGVGKTEIARRLSKLTGSPLLKVEASKFTEVGYVGRDVESIIRDLTDAAIHMVRDERAREVKVRAERAAEDRLLDLLVVSSSSVAEAALDEKRRALKKPLRDGLVEEHEVELEISEQKIPTLEMFGPQGMESMGLNFKDMFGGMFGGKKTRKTDEGLRGAADPRHRRGREAHRPLPGRGGRPQAGRGGRDRLSRRDRQDRLPRRGAAAAAARMSPARASSGICCPSSRAPTSAPSTASSAPTTSSSSPPARSTSRGHRI